jgi:hypothetical protein
LGKGEPGGTRQKKLENKDPTDSKRPKLRSSCFIGV